MPTTACLHKHEVSLQSTDWLVHYVAQAPCYIMYTRQCQRQPATNKPTPYIVISVCVNMKRKKGKSVLLFRVEASCQRRASQKFNNVSLFLSSALLSADSPPADLSSEGGVAQIAYPSVSTCSSALFGCSGPQHHSTWATVAAGWGDCN